MSADSLGLVVAGQLWPWVTYTYSFITVTSRHPVCIIWNCHSYHYPFKTWLTRIYCFYTTKKTIYLSTFQSSSGKTSGFRNPKWAWMKTADWSSKRWQKVRSFGCIKVTSSYYIFNPMKPFTDEYTASVKTWYCCWTAGVKVALSPIPPYLESGRLGHFPCVKLSALSWCFDLTLMAVTNRSNLHQPSANVLFRNVEANQVS